MSSNHSKLADINFSWRIVTKIITVCATGSYTVRSPVLLRDGYARYFILQLNVLCLIQLVLERR
uniref:Uncharacterized protein n=1 Tax=Arundo donax TaxID=35708 RepID=A0A0A9CQR0_ARUDO